MKLEFQDCYGYYEVYNDKSTLLGTIMFHTPWKRWTWEQENGIIMTNDCLKDVLNFIEVLKK